MPFGSFFKKVFKKTAQDVAEKYVGEDAAAAVGGAVDEGFDQMKIDDNMAAGSGGGGGGVDLGGILQTFTGNQQSGLQSLFGALGGSMGGMQQRASDKGMDSNLISCVMGMLSKSGGGSGSGGGGGGFNLMSLASVAQSLTKGGSGGGGGLDGFLSLLGGSGGGGSGSSNSILQVIIGLAKSFFAMQMGKNKSCQDWSDAGAKSNKDDDNFGNWGKHLVKDLIDPGKKDKDRMDEDPEDKPTGGKDAVKGWFDGHPEIGKMQKDVFDDIFDTTDEDDEDRLDDDPTPLIPAPKGFEPDCSELDQASILFLNTNILLDLRKEWRFLYSFKAHNKSFSEFVGRVELKGPTIVLIRDADGNVFGAFTSTSWADSEGGWIGNGDSFVFSIKPKMAVFHATGKDDNIMFMSKSGGEGLGLGGKVGRFGLGVDSSLERGSYHEDVNTYDLPPLYPEQFDISHLEVWGLGPETDADRERSKIHVRKPNLQVRSGGVDMDDLLGQIS